MDFHADQSPFDAEIVWSFQKAGQSDVKRQNVLKNCASEQILPNPFCDEGDFYTFRWDVSVKLVWRGHTIVFNHQSHDAYPSLTTWQSIIYNPQTHTHSLQDVRSKDGHLNQSLEWKTHRQALNDTVNIKQPYGIVLLKQERQRIMEGEPLEACVTTSLSSLTAENTTLYVQSIGDVTCYLNGEELISVEPIAHTTLNPMFDSWMPPKHTYYALPLQKGENQIVIFTRPDTSINWWGVGATVFDENGKVFVQ